MALELFNASLWHARCFDPRTEIRDFLVGLCTTKFAFVHLLSTELGAAYAAAHATAAAAEVLAIGTSIFRAMLSLPYFALGGLGWTTPQHIAFNHELYPNYYGPIWPSEQVPLAAFLEEHFQEFHADLDAILQHDGLFDRLRELERNAEGLVASPCGRRAAGSTSSWQTSARLGPGAWLKPHFGNSRRLVAHLGLIVPDGPITMNVGAARGLRWRQGKALIFDDTHAHDARHAGDEGQRYILHMMFCHPCEQVHLYTHLPSEACEFRDQPVRAEVSRALRAEMDAREAEARKAVRMTIPRNAPQDV